MTWFFGSLKMTLHSRGSTGLLSALSRSAETAHHICPARRSLRILSAPNAPRPSTSRPLSSDILTDGNATQTQVDTAGGKGHKQRLSRPKASIPPMPGEVYPPSRILDLGNPTAKGPSAGLEDVHMTDSKSKKSKRLEPQSFAANSSQRPIEPWQTQKDALKKKFGEQGWNPRKKLSPDTLEGIRALHQQYPQKYTTPVLAEQFKISPEAIRRILKSNWRPSAEKMEERRGRWAKRHDRIWDAQAEMGLKPKRKKNRKPAGPEDLDILPPIPSLDP